MNSFDYQAPTTLAGALELLAQHPGAFLLAGGTDLLVQMRAGRKRTGLVVDVKRVPELNEISFDPSAGLTLGAAVCCARAYEDPVVRRHYPSLAEVTSIIGGTPIQNRASVGGNLCNASPSADTIPLLIALQVRCRIAGPHGERDLPVEDFCVAPGRNALAPGELLVSLRFPAPPPGFGAHYLRFTPRNEMDIAVAGVGASVQLKDRICKSARIALAAVAPTPLFVRAAGESLTGKPLDDASIEAAAALAAAAASPISDMRGPAEFRRHLCGVLTRRALHAAAQHAQEIH